MHYSSPSRAFDVSSDGQVVVGVAGRNHPFRWASGSGMVGLGIQFNESPFESTILVSGDGSTVLWRLGQKIFVGMEQKSISGLQAYNLSHDGSILVGARNADQLRTQASLWSQTTGFVDLGFLLDATWSESIALDLSADGRVVVGYSTDDVGTAAFRWTAETGMIDLGFGTVQLRYVPREVMVSADGSSVAGVSANGEIVRWTEAGGTEGLGVNGRLFGISGNGSRIVGIARDGNYEFPFIWDAHNGVQNLVELFRNEYGLGDKIAEWYPGEVYGISDDGLTLIGAANSYSQWQAWLATIPPLPAVPEPGPAAQIFASAAALSQFRRRGRAVKACLPC